eukprot:5446945-Ditylum_brightwellii.AAC.1
MPTTDLNQKIKRTVGITNGDMSYLSTVATIEDDLRYLLFDAFPTQILLVKHCKLSIASKFLANKNNLDGVSTMSLIQESLNQPVSAMGTVAGGAAFASAPDP